MTEESGLKQQLSLDLSNRLAEPFRQDSQARLILIQSLLRSLDDADQSLSKHLTSRKKKEHRMAFP